MSKVLSTNTKKNSAAKTFVTARTNVDEDEVQSALAKLAEEDNVQEIDGTEDVEAADEKNETEKESEVSKPSSVHNDKDDFNKIIKSNARTKEELIASETTVGEKTWQRGKIEIGKDGKRYDEASFGEYSEELGGTVTKKGFIRHYEGSLGSFDYDPTTWAIGLKEITGADGVKATIPVLRYIKETTVINGSKIQGSDIKIPEGVTCLDYTFQDLENLVTCPKIPEGVTSMHGSFWGCDKMTRFCTDAKEGENGLGWFGYHLWGDKTYGKGGEIDMPSTIEDAAYAFAESGMTETYGHSSENLVDYRGMMYGSDLGRDDDAVELGSAMVMDAEDSCVPHYGSFESYTACNTQNVQSILEEVPGWSSNWNEETGELEKESATEEQRQQAAAINQDMVGRIAESGVEDTEMLAETDGRSRYGTVRTEHGYQKTQDVNSKNVKAKNGLLATIAPFLDRALVSLGEYTIVKKLTGSKLIGAAATFGLQFIGVLPKSMKPIVDAAAGMIGEDNVVGKGLKSLSDALGDNEVKEASSGNAVEKREQDLNDAVSADMKYGSQTALSDNSVDIRTKMAAEGAGIGRSTALLEAGAAGASSEDFLQIETMMSTVGAGMVARMTECASEGSLSEENKAKFSEQFMNLMEGLESYDKAAQESMAKAYIGDDAKLAQAQAGLDKTMQVSVGPMFDTMKELDEKYQFLSAEDKAKLNEMSFSGMESYDGYQVGSAKDYELQETQAGISEPVLSDSSFGYADEEQMYANAYLTEEPGITTENMGSMDAGTESKGAEVPLKMGNLVSGKSVEKTDKGVQSSRLSKAEELVRRVGGIVDTTQADVERQMQ